MFWVGFIRVACLYLSYLMDHHPEGFEPKVLTRSGDELLPSYDFIIVGAGSAGSVLANRLTEKEDWKVLLVEAGEQENEFSRTPLLSDPLLNTRFDWNYTTTPQKRACRETNGVCTYPRGRSLGGSSAINGMMYSRGYKSDYDQWGKDNPGWRFADVQPYFLKSEGNTDLSLPNRGRDGPLTVSYPPYRSPVADHILEAAVEKGAKNGSCFDYEGKSCIMYGQSTMRKGRRCSSSTAFLEPISQKRGNLHIITSALVTKLIFDGTAAKGIEFTHGSKKHTVMADKEVILSAGAFNSPKILMLSGIGPKEHLNSLGIEVLADLPVGENLQDHYYTQTAFEIEGNYTTTGEDAERGIPEYVNNQTGPLASAWGTIVAFVAVSDSEMPDVHYIFSTDSGGEKHLVTVISGVMRPKSVGSVKLKNTDPLSAPLIDVNAFEDESDFQLTKKAMMKLIEFMESPLLAKYKPKLSPLVECPKTESAEDYVSCSIAGLLGLGHAVGTAKMSPKNMGGVVDASLKVYGVDRLRVIDASIAPSVVSMNTNAAAIMIGERGADLVKKDYE